MQFTQQKVAQLTSGATQGLIVDQNGNCVELAGSNLAQVVTIGANVSASPPQSGVQVGTGIASGTAGRATAQNVATGTITLTKGSTSATLTSTTSGAFATGMVIGAAQNAIPTIPGTTITVNGTSITLSPNPALASGTFFCAAANFVTAEPGAWQALTLTGGNFIAAAGYWTPQGRLTSDVVTLRGAATNSSGSTLSTPVVATVPTLLIPQSTVLFGSQWRLSTTGNLTYLGSIANGASVGFDGLTYTSIAA